MTRRYQGPAWPCLISAVCPKQSEGSSGHWTSRWFSTLFTLYATNWFAPRILYQWTNGQEWCIRSPAQIAPKFTLVSLAGAWSTSCLNTDGPSGMGMWLRLLWLHTWSTGHRVYLSKAEVVDSQPPVTTRCLLESWNIQRHPDTLNDQKGLPAEPGTPSSHVTGWQAPA